jgi:bifunctional non-homologous end joining protein LigD
MSLPRWVEPQLPKLSTKAPSGPQWIHEIKLDGYRMAARIEKGSVRLLTRSERPDVDRVVQSEALHPADFTFEVTES